MGGRLPKRTPMARWPLTSGVRTGGYADKSTTQKKVRMPLSAKMPKVSLALSTTCERRLRMNLLALSPQQAQT